MLKQYQLKNFHFQLILYMAILTVIGILVIGSAQESVQSKQIIGFAAGMIIMVTLSLIDYSFLLRLKWLYYVGIIGLLILVQKMGDTTKGAQRWIEIAGIRFQPSELAKLVIILFFAAYFMKHNEKLNTIRVLGGAFLFAGGLLALILMQPDVSTTIVSTFIFIALLFIAGLSYKIIISVLAISVPIFLVGITILVQKGDELIEQKKLYPVRRIMAWLYPTDPKYAKYALQQKNSVMAIGSGQLWGKGLNNSAATSLKNSNYIIEPQADFIFAVAGEELGFVGTIIICLLLLLIVIECILIARKAKDLAGQLICCGMAAWVGFQGFVNICVATGLMPNTGIPLPFVSYGLTSLISLYIGMGFVLNVGLQPKKYRGGGN